jgi:hypothetical protein
MNPATLADSLAVVGQINPQTVNSTAKVSGAIAAKTGVTYLAIFQFGDMAAETIDCGIQSVDSDGTSNAADISGLQATQLAAHATNNDNKQIVIAFDGTDLIASGKSHFRARAVTGNTTGGPGSCVVVAVPRYGPAEGSDLTSVVQIVK